MKAILITIATFLFLSAVSVDAQVRFLPVPQESRLWIEGTAKPVDFVCTSENVDGFGLVRSQAPNEPGIVMAASRGETEIEVRIPVQRMDCGKARMNRDFRNALKADQYDEIIFRFNYAERDDANENAIRFIVTGDLTVAGVTRTVEVPVDGVQMQDESFRIRGQRTIRMTDFNVEPPTALMGLIQADDELTVHFDILVKPEDV